MLVAVVLASILAAVAGHWYSKTASSVLSHEAQCAKMCHPLSSRVERKYIDPASPGGYRNSPREVLCKCGTSVLGTSLF